MATKTWCKHDLDPATCSDCSPRHDSERAVPARLPPIKVKAKYHGICIGCGNAVLPGDEITFSAGDGGWQCECCA